MESHHATTLRPTPSGASNGRRRAGGFEISVVDQRDANEELIQLRSGRGGRTSKYEPLEEEIVRLEPGYAIRTELAKNEVGGLRGYLRRHHGERFVVTSARSDRDPDVYVAFITVNSEED